MRAEGGMTGYIVRGCAADDPAADDDDVFRRDTVHHGQLPIAGGQSPLSKTEH